MAIQVEQDLLLIPGLRIFWLNFFRHQGEMGHGERSSITSTGPSWNSLDSSQLPLEADLIHPWFFSSSNWMWFSPAIPKWANPRPAEAGIFSWNQAQNGN